MNSRDIRTDHKIINLQMAGGITFILIFLGAGFYLFHIYEIATLGERLAFALRWDSLIAITLLAGILNVGSRRYFGSEAVRDGFAADHLRVPLAFLSNTMEQSLVAVLVHLGLAATLPVSALQLIPLMAVLFILGRILFYTGYKLNPIWRAFGFSMTIIPTTVGCFYIIFHI